MKYDFDSYLLYEMTPQAVYTCRARVDLTIPVREEVLRSAAEKAFRRFPYYARTIRLNEENAFELEPSDAPIVVKEEGAPITLGSEETNGLLFAITYTGNRIYFNFAHNFCGGCGAMFWIKSTLWQYLTDEGYDIDPEGILVPGSPLQEGETDIPVIETLPDEEPIYEYNGGDSFFPGMDYMEFFQDPSSGGQSYQPVIIEKKALMNYARENDGSPNSILAAAMFRMCSRMFADAEQISGGIVCNYRADVGCPDTYRDLVRLLHVAYKMDIKDWPIEKLSTVARSAIYLQSEPELSWKECRKLYELRDRIDQLPELDQKMGYALEHSLLRYGPQDTFQVSYVGHLNWGGLSEYMQEIYAITQGHLMLEVNATTDKFCISFQTLTKAETYLEAFLKVLEEEGIPYEVGEKEPSNLPGIQFV